MRVCATKRMDVYVKREGGGVGDGGVGHIVGCSLMAVHIEFTRITQILSNHHKRADGKLRYR